MLCSATLRIATLILLTLTGFAKLAPAAENAAALAAALDSIKSGKAKDVISTLADDSYEGREAGSQGGRAAGGLVADRFKKLKLEPAGTQNGYFQTFDRNYRNVLGWLPGSDPTVANQYVLVCAHYDHVGYGTARNSYGPTGYIHNGADDNASGVSALLEVIEAFKLLPVAPRRSILFAAWDGEEKGLLGCKYWLSAPTHPLNKCYAAINMDMVGRLRNRTVTVYGTRTSTGLRQLVSQQNQTQLDLDFTWLMKGDSDHYPIFQAGIPVLMFHTGLHSDYHRPSDDVEKINFEGVREVSSLVFLTALTLADATQSMRFRATSTQETPDLQADQEQPLAPLPPRLGVSWARASNPGELQLTEVFAGSPAARAGLQSGDRLVRFAGQELHDTESLRRAVLAASAPVEVVVARSGQEQPITAKVELAGTPIRVGLSWRESDAEPGVVTVSRVVPGSPAAQAGIAVNDRIWSISGQKFAGSGEFQKLLSESPSPMEFEIERRGVVRHIKVARQEVLAPSPVVPAPVAPAAVVLPGPADGPEKATQPTTPAIAP